MSSRITEESLVTRTDGKASAGPAWQGKRVGRFRLVSELGRGAMGRVFRAEDTLLQRHVALKVLPKMLRRGSKTIAVERLISEARAAATLEHPHVVTVYEINESGGVYYIAMELLEGGSLRDIVKAAGPIDSARACLMCADAAGALAQAHELGIVHRDVKPANLMLTRSGRCKVADFGLARMDDAGDLSSALPESVGTPQFIAPELLKGIPASPRSDIYSLGATLWFLLTGHGPFEAETAAELLRKHLDEPLPDLADLRPDLPPGLVQAVNRAMAKRPSERFENAAQFEKVLRIYTIPTESTSATSLSAIMSVTEPLAPEPAPAAAPISIPRQIPRSALLVAAGVATILVLLTLGLAIRALWPSNIAAAGAIHAGSGISQVTHAEAIPAAAGAPGAQKPPGLADDAPMLAALGMQYAKRGQFTDAAANYDKALRMNPSEPLNYYYRACLAAYMGDVDAYRNTCKAMFAMFSGSTNSTVRDKTTKTCSLMEDCGVDPKEILTLSGTLSANSSPELSAWFSLCQGMALYRAGQLPQAIDVLENAKTPDRITRTTTAEFFQAMAHWRQGQHSEAQSMLKESLDRLDRELPKAGAEDLGKYGVEDWLICQTARRQAEALISH